MRAYAYEGMFKRVCVRMCVYLRMLCVHVFDNVSVCAFERLNMRIRLRVLYLTMFYIYFIFYVYL